jgi:two-component system alkaline phosphatase synthesis response regulator PhoP
MKKILIVEDDPAILKGLEIALRDEHYRVVSATDGEKGEQIARQENVDLIILDWMLPFKNGIEICQDLRKQGISTPIIMLTCRQEEHDIVRGLDCGANDYVTKPFKLSELLARVRANLPRFEKIKNKIDTYEFADIHLDFIRQEAYKDGKTIKFSTREFQIMQLLIQHEAEVVSRDLLLTEVWGYILNLRKKIEKNPAMPRHLLTIHKSGYKFLK